jgi:hypothetical protein
VIGSTDTDPPSAGASRSSSNHFWTIKLTSPPVAHVDRRHTLVFVSGKALNV